MDESGLQMNNKPGRVIATKGSKDVHVLTSVEKGENVSVLACTNAEGVFLPPVLILKGTRNKPSLLHGLPAGSNIYMNKKSSYITSELFMKWLKEHFLQKKGEGKVLLILDGHTSHTNQIEMLDFAEENDIILLCLPSPTTQALQPLDRSFFKPLKDYFKHEAESFMISNENRKISRDDIGKLIGKAWERAATIGNGTSGFEATGICPFNRNRIPEHFFQISDNAVNMLNMNTTIANSETNKTNVANKSVPNTSAAYDPQEIQETISTEIGTGENHEVIIDLPLDFFNNSENYIFEVPHSLAFAEPTPNVPILEEESSPSKLLNEIAPIPCIPLNTSKRKRSASVLSSKNGKSEKNGQVKTDPVPSATKKKVTRNKKNNQPSQSSVDESCTECLENYYTTTEIVDWIQCVTCQHWLHETCTMYGSNCNDCGRKAKRLEKAKKKMSFIRFI